MEPDKQRYVALKALALTLAAWFIFSWPLPMHVGTAIPGGSAKPAQPTALQPMQPGDHLQLDYHFWMFSDMLAGRTPWFYNIYEFNTGNDEERYEPGSYYLPFALFYTVGSWMAGRAFGWNFAGFLSLWLTAWFTYRLARRYSIHAAAAWLGAAAAVMLPYRWITLAGGSPTGFAMAWVPLLLLGLDIAVREDKLRGGLLAGLALVFSAWGDAHTFFFAILVTPCWCIFAFCHRDDFVWKDWRAYGRIAVALAPVAVFAAVAHFSNPTASRHIGEAGSKVRSLREVSLYSPDAEGLWSWSNNGISDHIYLGYAFAVVLLAGLVALLRQRRKVIGWSLLAAGMAGICILALGPNGPLDGRFFTAARAIVSPYGMIRQPAKIFCLLPSLAAVALAISLSTAARRPKALALAAGLLLLLEWRYQFQPIITWYETTQGAYRAVVESAERPARALVLPLWPGDSHYTSVYQHYATAYRVRMVNGYQPFVSKEYIETIFHAFESANQGALTDAQLDDLLRRGIDFIILHEDMFPEKVSPFPVGFTVRNLLTNPRLEPIKQDGAVWAFRIRSAGTVAQRAASPWPISFPARVIEWEKQGGPAEKGPGDDAMGGGFARVSPGQTLSFRKPVQAAWAHGLAWMLRVRGRGAVGVVHQGATTAVMVNADDWIWKTLLIDAPFEGTRDVALSIVGQDGQVDLDSAMLVAGTWRTFEPGQSVAIPAAAFFHAGHINQQTGGVAFTPHRDNPGIALYGPRLPFEPARYRISMQAKAAQPGKLGTLVVRYEGGRNLGEVAVHAPGRTDLEIDVDQNLPILCVFVYDAKVEGEIVRFGFERLVN